LAIYTQIIFATIFELLFFHAEFSMASIAGTVIIVGSAVFVALNKAKSPITRNVAAHSGIPDRSETEGVELEDGLALLEHNELEPEGARRLNEEDEGQSRTLSGHGPIGA